MELALTAACGLSAAITASSLARAVRLRHARPGTWPWTVTILWGCVLAACLTALGVLGILPGVVMSVVLAVIAFTALRRSGSAGAQIGAGPAHLYRDAADAVARAGGAVSWRRGEAGEGDDDDDAPPRRPAWYSGAREVPEPDAPPRRRRSPRPRREDPEPRAAAGTRTVPRPREDPALGPPPRPAEVAASVAVPPPWAELAGWIASYVPEDDNAQTAFLAGHAAGLVAVAHALGTHSETVINDIGLDPAYGAAILEVADRVADTSGDVALADQRYRVIYGELARAVENGLILPHRTREWFGGSGGPAPAAGDGTAAA